MSETAAAPPLLIESVRSGLVESVHAVSVAATDAAGELVADAGDPQRLVWWRSAAKPFQALALVEDGAADAFGFTPEHLALACASHSSEPEHRRLAAEMLDRIGMTEADLACGPHPPLGSAMAAEVVRKGIEPTPLWSNCSGKHAGMLALARHHGWPTAGYERAGHPVQTRLLEALLAGTGADRSEVRLGVDGCTTVCYALPLARAATGYARLAAGSTPALARLRDAMLAHPVLVAGTGRPCTDLMQAWPGEIIAKVGAEGVYSAALPRVGLGLTLKVDSGDVRAAAIALVAAARQLVAHVAPSFAAELPLAPLERYVAPAIHNTRGEATGMLRPAGTLRFSAPAGRVPVTAATRNGID